MAEFDVASELKAVIARENDEDRRMLLMLLLGVFEANLAGIDALSKKLDALRSDEQGLREAVLNGHSERHDKHHDWIEDRMASNCHEVCEWGSAKMAEEREAKKQAAVDAVADKRAARNAAINQGVTILISVCLGIGASATALVVALARGWLGPIGG